MKKVFTTLMVLAALLCVSFNLEAKKPNKVQEVTFITTIDCKNCVKKVEAKLPFEPGIRDMKVNLAEKTVWIKYDTTKTDPQKLAAAIEKIGFKATQVQAP